MKLWKFTKNKKQKGIVIGSIAGILLLIGGITLYRTFALYKEEQTFNVLKGTIPYFVYGDIKLAIKVDGKEDTIPTKESGNYAVKVECDNGATGSWNYSKWQVEVKDFKKGTKCDVTFTSVTESLPDISGDFEIFGNFTGNNGTRYYTTTISNLDNTKKYTFIVQPLCGIMSGGAPKVQSISENGSYTKITPGGFIDSSQAASIFQVENTTNIQFLTYEMCTNSGVHTFYWEIN